MPIDDSMRHFLNGLSRYLPIVIELLFVFLAKVRYTIMADFF